MRFYVLPLACLLLELCDGYKYLLYMPQLGRSHVNFLGKLTDALIDAGHNVTVVMPIFDTTVGSKGSSRATLIEIPQIEETKKIEEQMHAEDGIINNVWKSTNPLDMVFMMVDMNKIWARQCAAILDNVHLLAQLRKENFDVAYSEPIDLCGFGIFHLLGIEKTVITWSVSSYESGFEVTGAPYIPSYVPGSMAKWSDQMTFEERFYNFFSIIMIRILLPAFATPFNEMYREKLGNEFPTVLELLQKSSLVFVNNDPLVDFPRPTTHKILDIGGITVAGGPKKLNQTWNRIMSLRQKTALLSFGTFAKSYLMPSEYKHNIRETMRRFPEITFIWKYEQPEDDIGRDIDNIVPTTWMPQNDILYDPRLTLFITHCGQGSTTEAIVAGVPLIVIPVGGDQYRNAQVVKRNGIGMILEKEDLGKDGVLEAALREVLSNENYRISAKRVSSMLASRPFSPKEVFTRNMEFVARFGPLRNLDHFGTQLSFVQYYCLDIIAAVLFVASIVLFVVFVLVKCTLRKLCSLFHAKKAKVE